MEEIKYAIFCVDDDPNILHMLSFQLDKWSQRIYWRLFRQRNNEIYGNFRFEVTDFKFQSKISFWVSFFLGLNNCKIVITTDKKIVENAEKSFSQYKRTKPLPLSYFISRLMSNQKNTADIINKQAQITVSVWIVFDVI